MKKVIVIAVVAVIVILLYVSGSCNSDPNAALDYGPNYYYDTNKHQVVKKPY